MSTRQRRLIISLLIIAALGLLTWYLKRPEPIQLRMAQVEAGTVEQTVSNTRAGTVEACRRARLAPSIGGQIARLEKQEGDQVKRGELLLELWNDDLLAEVALNEAETLAAQSKAKAACLQAEVAQREADRLVRLRKTGAASEEAIDKAVTEARALAADCEAAKASAVVAATRINLAAARLQKTQLRAPFDGVVAEINGELNEYVTPSPPGIPTLPAVDLIDNGCFYVTAPIDEVDATRVRLGQPARISLDAFADRHFSGKVRRIADYVLDLEKQARTVDVEVRFVDNDDIGQLLAGYSADVEIIEDVRENTLRVPTEAVLNNDRVYQFDEAAGIIRLREVKVGKSNWDYTEILSGLASGDWIVTSVDREGVEEGAAARKEDAGTP